jgi:hypothetical protein
MSRIVDRLPFHNHQTVVGVANQQAIIRPHQIIVWVSLRLRGTLSPPFPAVLDTGHSHFFSIGERQLEDWAGISMDQLRMIGRARVNDQPIELFAAGLVLHRNKPGSRDELLPHPHALTLTEGIAVTRVAPPRLPLLGLRALVESGLRTTIDGEHRQVSINKPWRLWPGR